MGQLKTERLKRTGTENKEHTEATERKKIKNWQISNFKSEISNPSSVLSVISVSSVLVLFLAFAGGCQKAPPAIPAPDPRVASVTPAGTDLLIGIGAADHLVAVSNYDDPREGIQGKPRIGDYQSIDWEKLAEQHPQILLVQEADNRLGGATDQRAQELGIRIVNLKIETIQDIYDEMSKLADLVGQPSSGKQAVLQLQSQLATVRQSVAGKPPVRTLIVTNESGLDIAGPNTFLDELLTIAGGTNVASGISRRYASLDRETLIAYSPDAIVQLIPDGDKTPQVIAQAQRFWQSLPDLPAVKNHRVYIVTDWYSLQPGFRVGQLAATFAHLLHPEITP
jgi:iron complex transport system substrate-binding protein